MAKFIVENISYDVVIQWLTEGREMEFSYNETSIRILYVEINDVPTFLVTEKDEFKTLVTKYISRHQILAHEFSNGKTFQEMWDEIELLEIF